MGRVELLDLVVTVFFPLERWTVWGEQQRYQRLMWPVYFLTIIEIIRTYIRFRLLL